MKVSPKLLVLCLFTIIIGSLLVWRGFDKQTGSKPESPVIERDKAYEKQAESRNPAASGTHPMVLSVPSTESPKKSKPLSNDRNLSGHLSEKEEFPVASGSIRNSAKEPRLSGEIADEQLHASESLIDTYDSSAVPNRIPEKIQEVGEYIDPEADPWTFSDDLDAGDVQYDGEYIDPEADPSTYPEVDVLQEIESSRE